MSLANTHQMIFCKQLLNKNLATLQSTRMHLMWKDMATGEIDTAIHETLDAIMDLDAAIQRPTSQTDEAEERRKSLRGGLGT